MSFTCHLCVKQGKSGLGHAPGPNCPIVKNFTCGYCKEKGHTIKHCPVLHAKKNAETLQQKLLQKQFPQPKIEATIPKKPIKRVEQIVNHFGIIEDDSKMPETGKPKKKINEFIDEDIEDSEIEWPSLGVAKVVAKKPDMSWGKIGNWSEIEN
jgi:hypothetical protein